MRTIRLFLMFPFLALAACSESPSTGDAVEAVPVTAGPDVVSIRAEPDARAEIVGAIPANSGGITVTAQAVDTLDWVQIRFGDIEGWVDTRYLHFLNAGQTLPIRLSCTGTEPFWGIDLSYSRLEANFVFSGAEYSAGFAPPVSPASRTTSWLFSEFDGSQDFVLVDRATCSDGMSDAAHPYGVTARLDGQLLAGCCR
jgi:hypothetical protein